MISSIVNKAKTSRVFKNISWLVGGKVVQMIIAFVVNILTARYLGSSDFGLINYASVYTGFFASLCSLGLNSVIVKEMIEHKDKQGELLGTSIVLRLIASALSWISIICLSCLIDKGEPLTTKIVGLCCIGMLFQAFTILEYWFQARLESKVCAIATIIAYLIMSAYKVVLLVLGKSVEWFAVASFPPLRYLETIRLELPIAKLSFSEPNLTCMPLNAFSSISDRPSLCSMNLTTSILSSSSQDRSFSLPLTVNSC